MINKNFQLSILLILLLISSKVIAQQSLPQGSSSNARTALIIGNSLYQTSPLKNPANDAQDMARVLKQTGFDVTLKIDASQREMEHAIRNFGKKLRKGGAGLFYYAGHGIQVRGRNYLIPIGSIIETESDVKYEAVDAGLILGKMEDAGNSVNIVILDACRNNPFARSFRSADRGLARMDAPKGSLIAYATSPGSVAADGNEGNGIYTKHLIKNIRNSGLTIEQVLKKARVAVAKETANAQIPWESSSMMGDFYFYPNSQNKKISSSVSAIPEKPTSTINYEQEMWILVKGSNNLQDIESFLKSYPNGHFQQHAKLKRSQLISLQNKNQNKNNSTNKFNTIESFSTQDYQVVGLKFFEALDTAPDIEDRNYKTTFRQELAKRIWTELELKNFQYNKRSQEHEVKWVYYNPDGSVNGKMEKTVSIDKHTRTSLSIKGWGWKTPGNWNNGTYKVKVFIDDIEAIEKNFTIKAANKDYTVTGIRFFEGGDNAPPSNDRQYATSFYKGSTKRIWTELKIKNFRYNDELHSHDIKWVYYDVDGDIYGTMEAVMKVKPEWQNAQIPRGWGFENPGKWKNGSYKVKVFMDGLEVAEETFTIHSNNDEYEFTSIRFFEAGDTAPEDSDRVFSTSFSKDDSRRIWTELKVKNLKYNETIQEHDIKWVYYDHKGDIDGTMKATMKIQPEWKNARIQKGWGYKSAGNWKKGTYKVKVYMDDLEVDEQSYTID